MPHFLINWDAGFGTSNDVVETDTQQQAVDAASQEWEQETQSQADYGAELLDVELCGEHDLEPSDYGLHPSAEQCVDYGWSLEDYGYDPEDD